MKYTEYVFLDSIIDNIKTEALFEIATERARGTELIRFTLNSKDAESRVRLKNAMIRFMKSLKTKGTIQFYAFAEAFSENSTEAMFLKNKYPDIFKDTPCDGEGAFFVFVRI